MAFTFPFREKMSGTDIPSNIIDRPVNSHYRIDYALYQFSTWTREAIAKNPAILKEPKFREYLELNNNLRKNVIADRNLDGQNYAVGATDADFVFKIHMAKNSVNYNNTVLNALRWLVSIFRDKFTYDCSIAIDIITIGTTTRKLCGDDNWGLPRVGTNPFERGIFNFYFRQYPNANDELNPAGNGRYIHRDIEAILKAYREAISIPPPAVKAESSEELARYVFDESIKNISTTLQSKDYTANYWTIENLLGRMTGLVDNLSHGSFLEANIVNPIDNSYKYENLSFTDDNMPDEAVYVPPKDSLNDLTTVQEMLDTVAKFQLADKITGKTIQKIFNIPEDPDKEIAVSTYSKELDTLKQVLTSLVTGNSMDFDEGVANLLYSTIFEEDKKIEIKYVDAKEIDRLEYQKRTEQNAFMVAIKTSVGSQLKKYQTNYPVKQIRMSGGDVVDENEFINYDLDNTSEIDSGQYDTIDKYISSASHTESENITGGFAMVKNIPKENTKYKFEKESKKLTSQTGGSSVEWKTIESNYQKESKLLDTIEKTKIRNNDMIINLDKNFFMNKDAFDVDKLEQQNILLVEMMNIMNTETFLMSLDASKYATFRDKLHKKTKEFGNLLTNTWRIMRARTGTSTEPKYDAIRKKIIEGTLMMDDFVEYFQSTGLDVTPVDYTGSQVFWESMEYSGAVETLANRLTDFNRAVDALREMTEKGVTIPEQDDTIEKLYQKLYSGYSIMSDIDKNIEEAYQAIETKGSTLVEIKKAAGNLIESNIKMANLFSNNIITIITAYDSNINILGDLVTSRNRTKNRLNDFLYYMRGMNKLCEKNNIDFANVQLVINTPNYQKNITNLNDLKKSYSKYVTDIINRQKNIIPNMNLDKKFIVTNGRIKELESKLENIYVLAPSIYQYTVDYIPTYSRHYLIDGVYYNDTKKRIATIGELINQINAIDGVDKNGLLNKITKPTSMEEARDLIISTIKILRHLLLYPTILEKINIPDEIKKICDLYMAPDPTDIQKIANNILKMIDSTTYKLETKNVVDHDKIMYTTDMIKKSILRGYSIRSDLYSENNDANIKTIMDLYNNIFTATNIKKLEQNKNYQEIYDFFEEANKFSVKISYTDTVVKGKITEYLNQLYVDKNINTMFADEKDFVENYIYKHIQTVLISIYKLYYTEISSYYQILNAYVFENERANKDFFEISTTQRDITKLETRGRGFDMVSFYKELGLVADEITNPGEFRNFVVYINNGNYYTNMLGTNNTEDIVLGNHVRNANNSYKSFSENSIQLLKYIKDAITNTDVVTGDLDWVIDFDSNSVTRLYTPSKTNWGTGIKYPGSTVTLGQDASVPIVSYTKGGQSYPPIQLPSGQIGIVYKVDMKVTNGDKISVDVVNSLIKILKTTEVIMNVLPNLLDIKHKLHLINDASKVAKYDDTAGSNVAEKTALHTALMLSTASFDRVQSYIRDNKAETFMLREILPTDIMLFKTILTHLKTTDTTNSGYTEVHYHVYLFLTDITSFYISYLVFLLNTITHQSNFGYVWTGIIKPFFTKHPLGGDLNMDYLYQYTLDIKKYTDKIVQNISDTADKLHNEQSMYVLVPAIDNKEIFDHYFDNRDISIKPLFYVMFLSNDETLTKNMKELEKLTTEYAHIDMFSRRLDTTLVKDWIENIITGIVDWEFADEAKNKTHVIDGMNKLIKIFDDIYYTKADPARKPYKDEIVDHPDYKYNILEPANTRKYRKINTGTMATVYAMAQLGGMRIEYIPSTYATIDYSQMQTNAQFDPTVNTVHPAMLQNIRRAMESYRAAKNDLEKNNRLRIIFRAFLAGLYQEYLYFIRTELWDRLNKIIELLNNFKNNSITTEISKYIESLFKDNESLKQIYDIGAINAFFTTSVTNKLLLDDTNKNNIKYLFKQCVSTGDSTTFGNYQPLLPDVKNAFGIFEEFASNIKRNFSTQIQNEIVLLTKMNSAEYDLTTRIHTDKNVITHKSYVLSTVIRTMSRVMFNRYYKNTPIIGAEKMNENLALTIDTYKKIQNLIEAKINSVIRRQKVYSLELSKHKYYVTFKGAIGMQVGNDPQHIRPPQKIYKQMSFGLIEYYLDIINDIIKCISESSFDQLTNVGKYFAEYHFITLHRCRKLFEWIIHEYLDSKKKEERDQLIKDRLSGVPKDVIKENMKNMILRKKIQILMTKDDALNIFVEFNAIKELLDRYRSYSMPPVSLFMRINDWELGNDPDPLDEAYEKLYQNKKLTFMNYGKFDDANKLRVQIDSDTIPLPADKIGTPQAATWHNEIKQKYSQVWDKMSGPAPGIAFERIINSMDYPDADIIANQMSTGPLLTEGKGIMLMTYGYSGVGKTATLFGTSSKNGMLQATLSQLPTDSKIYFRVYEIYGLGTQFNFTWNPKSSIGGPVNLCYPEFYQMVIHHQIKTIAGGLDTDGDPNQIVFTNRADILSYIMALDNPAGNAVAGSGTLPLMQPDGTGGFGRHPTLNNNVDAGNKLTKAVYTQIAYDNYKDFSTFIGSVDAKRKKGFGLLQAFEHTLKQIKSTINNPESSRSILVYDFQVELQRDSGPIYVPFVIYDLPGKEDLYRTYIDKGPADVIDPTTFPTDPIERKKVDDNLMEQRKGAFSHLGDMITGGGLTLRPEKASCVFDPFLLCTFRNNVDIAVQLFRNIAIGNLVNPLIQQQIIQDALAIKVKYLRTDDDLQITESTSQPLTFGDLYTDPSATALIDFSTLFNNNNIKAKYLTIAMDTIDTYTDPATNAGGFINAIMLPYPEDNLNPAELLNVIFSGVIFVLIYALLKNNYYDIIIKLISDIAGSSGISVNEADPGNWSPSKIYAFFEAFYINENISGLVHYLITDTKIVNQPSSTAITPQPDKSIIDTLTESYQLYTIDGFLQSYRTHMLANDSTAEFGESVPYKAPEDIWNLASVANSKKSPIDRAELRAFCTEFGIPPGGAYLDRNPRQSIGNMIRAHRAVIARMGKETYNSNALFRNGVADTGTKQCTPDNQMLNPNTITWDKTSGPNGAITPGTPVLNPIQNTPLLKDFIDPYKAKISNFYIFYLITNTAKELKAEEQLKLLNSSMPFITTIGVGGKKKCV